MDSDTMTHHPPKEWRQSRTDHRFLWSVVLPGPGDRQDCQRISGKRRRKSMAVLSVPGERNSPSAAFHLRHGSSVGNFYQLSRSNPPDADPCPKRTEPFYEQDVEVLFLSGGIVGYRRRAHPPIPRQCPGVAR